MCVISAGRGRGYFYGHLSDELTTRWGAVHHRPMFIPAIFPLLPAHPAMLLVLLPTVGSGVRQVSPLARTATNHLLHGLQLRLGSAIRVLKVDQSTHPAVVHAFEGQGVPAFVLLRDGAELWRQQGLPEGEMMAELLLSKLEETGK